MKNILLLCMLLITTLACTNKTKKTTETTLPNNNKEYVEILYFHGKQRCITCNAIESLTREVIQTHFAKQLKEGTVVLRIIDISNPDNESLSNKYEVTWSSLFINHWDQGKEQINNLTDFAFTHVKSTPEQFKTEIKDKITNLLTTPQ